MNSSLKYLQTEAEHPRETHAYRAEGAPIRFTEHLVTLIKASGLTRSTLAERITEKEFATPLKGTRTLLPALFISPLT